MPATKHDAQGFGSALSYARRYSLMAACGIAPEDDDGNQATRTAPVQAVPKAVPKAPPVVPKQIVGKDAHWQLKVSTEDETSPEDWAIAVAEATSFAREMAQSVNDVNNIYKINKVVYDKLKGIDGVTYSMLLDRFKTMKEKFEEKADEYVPE